MTTQISYNNIYQTNFNKESIPSNFLNLFQNEPLIQNNIISQSYLPLTFMISNLYLNWLNRNTTQNKNTNEKQNHKNTYIIGLTGSVSSGKTTTANIIKTQLEFWNNSLNIFIVSTDSFLFPNKILEKRQILDKKGFPESYDIKKYKNFLSDIKQNKSNITIPVYSHETYDITSNTITVNNPDILIIEGLNTLQTFTEPNYTFTPKSFIDFNIYIEANKQDLLTWYINRFNTLRNAAKNSPLSFYNKFKTLTQEEAELRAQNTWKNINLKNLITYIEPTKEKADLIIIKSSDHKISGLELKTKFSNSFLHKE